MIGAEATTAMVGALFDHAVEHGALHLAQRMLELNQESIDWERELSLLLASGQHEEATELLARNTPGNGADPMAYADAKHRLGNAYKELGNWQVAHLREGREVYQEHGKTRSAVSASVGLANALIEGKQWDEALEHFRKAEEFYTEEQDVENLGRLYNNMGYLYQVKGQTGRAREFYDRAVQTFGDTFDPGLVLAHVNIGDMAFGEGHTSTAVSAYSRVVELTDNVEAGKRSRHILKWRAAALLNLGAIHAQEGGISEAISFYRGGVS